MTQQFITILFIDQTDNIVKIIVQTVFWTTLDQIPIITHKQHIWLGLELFQNLFAQYPSNKGRTTRFMPLIKETQHGKDDEVLTPSSHEIANP